MTEPVLYWSPLKRKPRVRERISPTLAAMAEKTRTSVRKHKRRTPNGGLTPVRKHEREVVSTGEHVANGARAVVGATVSAGSFIGRHYAHKSYVISSAGFSAYDRWQRKQRMKAYAGTPTISQRVTSFRGSPAPAGRHVQVESRLRLLEGRYNQARNKLYRGKDLSAEETALMKEYERLEQERITGVRQPATVAGRIWAKLKGLVVKRTPSVAPVSSSASRRNDAYENAKRMSQPVREPAPEPVLVSSGESRVSKLAAKGAKDLGFATNDVEAAYVRLDNEERAEIEEQREARQLRAIAEREERSKQRAKEAQERRVRATEQR